MTSSDMPGPDAPSSVPPPSTRSLLLPNPSRRHHPWPDTGGFVFDAPNLTLGRMRHDVMFPSCSGTATRPMAGATLARVRLRAGSSDQCSVRLHLPVSYTHLTL